EMIDHHSHGRGAGVPAARNQHRVSGIGWRPAFGVERLRIVFLREADNLLFAHQIIAELEHHAGLKIGKITIRRAHAASLGMDAMSSTRSSFGCSSLRWKSTTSREPLAGQ